MRGDGTDRMHEQLLAGFPMGRDECLRGQTHSVLEVIVLTMPVADLEVVRDDFTYRPWGDRLFFSARACGGDRQHASPHWVVGGGLDSEDDPRCAWGDKYFAEFFVEGAAAMMVASTIVPSRSSKPRSLRCALMPSNSLAVRS